MSLNFDWKLLEDFGFLVVLFEFDPHIVVVVADFESDFGGKKSDVAKLLCQLVARAILINLNVPDRKL